MIRWRRVLRWAAPFAVAEVVVATTTHALLEGAERSNLLVLAVFAGLYALRLLVEAIEHEEP